jgi:hypothetical protein
MFHIDAMPYQQDKIKLSSAGEKETNVRIWSDI